MEALRGMNLPPGFGFHPSDTELVSHYLKRKILGHKIEYDLIPEVDIYKHEPWDLPAKCTLPIEDNKWHFFASRDRKYPTGSRSNRATVAGYWKSTGKDRAIKLNKRTLGTKKTLVFHEGRPPSGRRTEWIMHEYYLDESECQVSPDRKDAFVLCRVTKRNDWGLENDNEVCDRNPHPQQLNDSATSVVSSVKPEDVAASVICAEETNHVSTSVVSPEPSSDVAMPAITANAASPNGDNELQEWLEELFDPSFNPAADNGSADLSLTEEYAESSNSQNPGSVAPKIESDHASPIEDGIDVRDLLTDDFNLSEELHNMWYTATDDFHSSMLLEQAGQADIGFDTNPAYSMVGMDNFTLPDNFEDGTAKVGLQIDQENNNPNLSNGNVDTVVEVRRRNAPASASNSSPFARSVKMQVGIKRMVTSNSESINQTIKFADNSGRLNSMTHVEHRKKHADDATTVKQSDALKPSGSHSNQGYHRGITNAFRCSSAGFKLHIFFAVFVIVAAVVTMLLRGYRHSGISS